MKETQIDFGFFKLYLPDGDRRSFLIYGDFRIILGVEHQSEAIKKIKNSITDFNFKPQPKIYFEEQRGGISTKNPETIFKILAEIDILCIPESKLNLSVSQWNDLRNKLVSWKAPKSQKWEVGSVFSIRVKDSTFVFGQVVGNFPTVALFNLKSSTDKILLSDLDNTNIVTILHVTSNNLDNWTWEVIGKHKLLADKDSGSFGSDNIHIGHTSHSPNVLETVCNYFWFKINTWTDENDLKKLILIKD